MMQEALPYKTWTGQYSGENTSSSIGINAKDETSAERMISENAVIVFGRRGCCMCHVIKQLLQGHGVNPSIVYVDEHDETALLDQLTKISGKDGSQPQFPAVYVGGKLFGGLERVMATHISGELVPILKEAGALWL